MGVSKLGSHQKAMYDLIEKAKNGDRIPVASQKDAEFWGGIASWDYGKSLNFVAPAAPSITAVKRTDYAEYGEITRDLDTAWMKSRASGLTAAAGATTTTAALGGDGSGVWGSNASAAKPEPLMLLPIEKAPKNGREVMLFCPNERPQHVAAKYMKVKQDGELCWEGWIYADELLADACPLGPQGATHFYELPTTSTRISTQDTLTLDKLRDSMREVNDALSSKGGYPRLPLNSLHAPIPYMGEYEDERLTPAQALELMNRGISPKNCDWHIVRTHEAEELFSASAVSDARNAPSTVKVRTVDTPCPVIERGQRSITVVLPGGALQQISV